MNKLLLHGTLLFLSLAAVSCHTYDEREPVLPPTVEVAPNTLSGVITDMAGNPIQGVTVTLGNLTAQTDANGMYLFESVAQGSYDVKATANGMFDATTKVNFTGASSQNLLWSTALNKKVVQNLVVSQSSVIAKGDIESENIPNNEEGSVNIEVEVPANTVPANTTIYITPIYTEESAEVSRAAESTMLIGATLSCSDPNVTLSSPIDLTFSLDGSVITSVTTKEYDAASDTWHNVAAEVDGTGNLVIKATKFTSYGIFLPVSVTKTTTSEPILFATSLFDNREGVSNMYVESAPFTYKTGMQIRSNAKNKLEGLLIEYLAREYGFKVTEVQGDYPLNVNLAVGQGISLNGAQAAEAIRVASGNTSVEGTRYGNVTVAVTTFSVDHNGGAGGEMN